MTEPRMGCPPANSYAYRAIVLREMGFASYRAYLASPLWKQVREKAFKTKGRKCVLCGATATQVHHSTYSRKALSGRRTRTLHPLCAPCHERIEFDENGEKLRPNDVEFRRRQARKARRAALRATAAKPGATESPSG